MSILSNVENFIEKKIIGVSNNTKVKSAQKIHEIKPNSIVENKNIEEENEDTISIKSNVSPKTSQTTPRRSAGQIRESIKQKCQANNINFAQLLRKLPQIAGLSREKFDALSGTQQERVLIFLEKEVDRVIQLQKKYGSSNETNTVEIVTESAKNKYEAQAAGVDVVKVEEEAGNINEELGNDFKNLSLEEKRAKFNEMAKNRKENFERRLQQKLSKVPEKDRVNVEKRLRAEHEYAENARFNEILATQDSDTALEAIRMQPAQNMAKSTRAVLESRASKEIKTTTADKITVAYSASLMESYAERGEKPSGEVISTYTCCAVSAKSAEGVREYQRDYAEQRRAFENGENVPPYLDKEYFTSTAKGIGEGALANTNMSANEKASFIADWKEEAKKYDDYEIVTKYVDEKLTTNEFKEIAEKIKTISDSKTKLSKQITQNKPYDNETEKIKDVQTLATGPRIQSIQNTCESSTEEKSWKSLNTTSHSISNPIANSNHTPILIVQEIKTTNMDRAIKKFGHSAVIETVLDDPNLKHMRPLLATIIKGYDLNSLKSLAQNCSAASFVYICSIVNKDFVAELKDERTDLCYSARKQVENMEKQHA